MLNQFIHYLKQAPHPGMEGRIAVAVSGGIDSVVLCELCKQANLNFYIIHCNFGLRGKESIRDEEFVAALGSKYHTDVVIKKFDTTDYAEENKLSIQEAARDLRYQWFNEIKLENKASLTLLAHHANDNVETLLMNFFRGTGLNGLTGIPEYQPYGNCFRPLLHFTRKQIEEFAATYNLAWVEDSSNASIKYTRNLFRHELIPAIKKIYPQVDHNLLESIGRFKKINALYQLAVADLKSQLCDRQKEEVRVPIKKLLQYQHTSLIYEIIREFGFGEKQVEEIIKLTNSSSGKFIENDIYQIIRHRNWLVIAPKVKLTDTVAIAKDTKMVQFQGGCLEISNIAIDQFRLEKSEQLAQIDAKSVQYPLLLRKWRKGDYFYPLGMRKKKKIARFFIDKKLSKNQKENSWVLESNNRIIWITGQRIDDRFKITPQTKEVIQFSITSDGHACNS